MKVIVGLGNPGSQYLNTRHNMGFITLDELAHQEGLSFNRERAEGVYAEWFLNGEKILLVKPLTYMNRSGHCVGPIMDYFNVDTEDLLVVYDDMDLAVGKLRLRFKGSAGGHRGMKDIQEWMGTTEIKRLKLGIGHPNGRQAVVDHVLTPFKKDEHEAVLGAVLAGVDALKDWASGKKFEAVMSQYNQ